VQARYKQWASGAEQGLLLHGEQIMEWAAKKRSKIEQ
jgi:hypothetical protein